MKISSSEHIASQIEESILRGDYSNGDKLNEVQLSTQFGVSRTPIREALQKLSQTGLVEQIPGRGVFIRQPGPVEIIELFEMMAELESACGRLAAIRISDSALEELQKANANCLSAMKANESDTYYFANQVFHMIIYRESGNRILENETKRLHQRLQPYRRVQLQVRGRIPQSMAEHEEIIKALSNGESEKTAMLLRDHIVIQGEKFRHLMSTLNEPS